MKPALWPRMATVNVNVPAAAPDLRPWVTGMVRLGYIAKGIIYLLIGTLAFRLAFGFDGGRVTDASGALRVLLQQPFGVLLIGTLGVGILAYAGWQVCEGLLDARGKGSDLRGWMDRSLTVIKGVVYGAIGWEALRLVLGVRTASQDADDYARDVMQYPFGDWFFALVGIGVAIYGATQIWKSWNGQFDDDVDARRMAAETGRWSVFMARAGVASRGVLLIVMGILLTRAGLDRSPSEAGGMSESLWTLMTQPYGSLLMGAAAAGLACFGVFQLLHWRYARLAPMPGA